MFQSGLFAPKRSAPDVIFTATGDFTAMPVARSHIYSYIWRFLGVEVSWTPPYGIKTELIPEPKVRSRNEYFLVTGIAVGIDSAWQWLETESESAPVFLAESESISVSWDQAQVCPTQYEKCETSISFLNTASI